MLVLSRKSRESVVVGGASGFESLLKVTVLDIRGTVVKLGFEVDASVPIHRAEVWERIPANKPPEGTWLHLETQCRETQSAAHVLHSDLQKRHTGGFPMSRTTQPPYGTAPVDNARRNWFAGLAMQALVPDETSKHVLHIDEIDAELVARTAYKLADAMEAEATRSVQPEFGGSPTIRTESQSPYSVDLPQPRLPEGVFDSRPR